MVNVDHSNKIAITGMAWSTALGNDLESTWKRLLNGESGFTLMLSDYKLRNDKVAAVNPETKRLSASEHLLNITKATLSSAIHDAKITTGSQRVLLVVGTSFGARLDDEAMTDSLLHEWVDTIASEFGITPIAISTACSSASDAILTGSVLIKAGIADICICGGADILGDSKRLAHSALGTMSPTVLRSFDEEREGTLLGEGAGFIVLEKMSLKLNKPVYAFLSGCGSANDAAGLTAPDEEGNGIRLAIERSLNDAKLQSSDIKLINAHGSGTRTNDAVESKSYNHIFKEIKPTVFATKGALGHSLGATGALEAIAVILALRDQIVPPIVNLTNPITDSVCHFPKTKLQLNNVQFGLSLTIGFGGFNTSLIFEKVN